MIEMRRVLGLLALLTVAGAIATGSAAAKGVYTASVCGSSGCTSVQGQAAVWPLMSWWYTPFHSHAVPALARYYSIRIRERSAALDWVMLYVPGRRSARIWQNRVPPYKQSIGPYWRTVPADAMPVLNRAVRKLAPYASPARWPR